MLSTMSTWGIRVAAALLLASWLRMSNGNAFWAGVLPALLACGATLVVLWHVLRKGASAESG
jgi:CHASE2 domain-containing sensor protein